MNQALAATGNNVTSPASLLGGFVLHKWIDKTLLEGQFMFLQIIARLLLEAKSMMKSVPNWLPNEHKTLPEFLILGPRSS